MSWYTFEKYIENYSNPNRQEWTVLFEQKKEETNGYTDDIFGFCALLDNNEKNIKSYLHDFEWGFSSNSFGSSYFEKISYSQNGKFVDEINFVQGNQKEEFTYLVAYRTFNKKYESQLEINPLLIWFGNLVKLGNDYFDPVSDECILKTTTNSIIVETKYLRNFLASINKVCVLVYDHRRFGNSQDTIVATQKPIANDYNYTLYTLKKYEYKNYNLYANIIGKSIIYPFTKCSHSSLDYFQDDKFENFIISIDENTGEEIFFTCDERKLANYFGANPEAPHFLTPIFFNRTVLNKYKTDTQNYEINDGHIRYLDEWILPFTVNEENKVIVWLGDLGRIPYKEQSHWKQENILPKGELEKNFIDQQLNNVFVDCILPEKWLFTLIKQANEQALKIYSDCIFNELSQADKSLESAFILPVSNNIDEYKEFLIQFCKIIVESINLKLISTRVVDKENLSDSNGKTLGSVAQLSVFFNQEYILAGGNLCDILKKLYAARSKLSGHTASISSYNKAMGREKTITPDWISDAKYFLTTINEALSDLIEELMP